MNLVVRYFELRDYMESYREMVEFNRRRGSQTADEIWFLQHPPVYTLGLAGRTEHLLDTGTIPVVRSDRGGQVTYHGPGQLLIYLMLDLDRRHIAIKALVNRLEQAVIDMLDRLGLTGSRVPKAPGVYIRGKKIAALGIRVRNGCSYHGMALNVDLDLTPFQGINPCGYPGLDVTRLSDFGITLGVRDSARLLQPHLLDNLGYAAGDLQVVVMTGARQLACA
jgi:lipoyl(octanoyl) transferase